MPPGIWPVRTAASSAGTKRTLPRKTALALLLSSLASPQAINSTCRSATRNTSYSSGPQGDSASRNTTVDNAKTGQTNTYSSGYNGDDHYASKDGNVYTNTGSGWQKTTASGTQAAAPEDTSWADREAQARSTADDRFGSFQNGGGAFRGWGGGDGSFANRFSAGGFGDRFGEGSFRAGGGFRR